MLPDCGWMELQDAETGEIALADTSNRGFREEYLKTTTRRQEQLDLLFKLTGIDAIKIIAGTSYVNPLVKFFLLRERRQR